MAMTGKILVSASALCASVVCAADQVVAKQPAELQVVAVNNQVKASRSAVDAEVLESVETQLNAINNKSK